MLTDRKRLEKIRKELLESEENSYARMTKDNVLYDLIASTEKETEELSSFIIIPIYEHDIEFLKEILKELGYYNPTYEKEYNYFFSTTCYNVRLRK